MDKKRERGSRSKVLRFFVGALLFLVAFWFLFAGIIADHAAKTVTLKVATSTERLRLKHWKWNGRERDFLHGNSNFFRYVSKRRVPNGPDPIHNRKAVKTRQPPGA
ncbi:hypothetical protein L484_010492 [Morus notabilis]|uniref:CLAVATA3/ESR (CLE)-related protein 25 n=1 Tax=Morus notabilis TaxID=981085 RepID=W9RBH7_9ROSA|nr:CLAVATA3/ESR (CLE)-related protein 25 [Morus notabilis]EXB47707.1 hypothetical protein L484_010492 [Morus notabilis]